MSLSENLYNAALEELGEGHLALDRLGSPREFDTDDGIRELTIAERIKFVFPLPVGGSARPGVSPQPAESGSGKTGGSE